ncbi:branched-chain amino acid transport system II carrier protein [Eubacteriales bacterium KG127]
MDRKLTTKDYILLASMLFGMFFGAGNLIFPVHMGQLAGANMWPAVVGFCLTGVGLPLLGVAALGISKSEGLFHMSSMVGKKFAYFFTVALYLTIGPLFAIPRTATVSYQVGIAPFIPDSMSKTGLAIFSFIFFAAVLFFSLKPSGIMTWIGKILNPVFLVFLGILIVAVFVSPMGSVNSNPPMDNYIEKSFFTGFLEGYNTMDALASLAFGIVLIDSIKRLGVNTPKQISLSTIKAGVLSVILMAAIYCALTIAGAQSRGVIGMTEDGGIALSLIAKHYFSKLGALILGSTITFACLKTAIALVTACGETFSKILPMKWSYKAYAIGFSVFSFALANVGLSNIIAYSIPVLIFLYPLTIVLIFLGLVGGLFNYNKTVFSVTMTFTVLAAILDLIKALPLPASVTGGVFKGLFEVFKSISAALPFNDFGMGWIVPATIGFVLGLAIYLAKGNNKSA